MASPHPIPTNIKKLRGTHRKDRGVENEVEHKPLAEYPSPPDHLTEDGKAQWYVILSAADNMGYLAAIAVPQLERYITLWEVYADAWNHCHDKKGGLKTVVKQGNVFRRNPYYDIMMSTSVEMRQIEVQWGWTPSSKSKVASMKDDNEEFDEFSFE